MIRLEGERVVLRPFREDEFEQVVMREAGPDASAEARRDLRDRLWRSGAWTDHSASDSELRLAVEADGVLVGDCQVRRSRWAMPPGVAEMGIQLFDEAAGRGLGTDAIATLTRFLLEQPDVHRVQISTDVDNGAMRRVAEKAGLVFEGVLRGFMGEPLHPRPTDYAMYAKTTADLEEGR
jgi:RimJ/RimL family protein N-acetyltransferase